MRTVQLMLRIIQLNAAVGLLVLVILITHMADMTAWVMRILVGYSPSLLSPSLYMKAVC